MQEKKTHLANQLCFSIYNSNRLFNQFYKKSLKSFDLTYTQYLVLLSLWEQDGQSLQELGQQFGLTSNTLTPLLKRLEDKGYLMRMRPKKDRCQLLIQLTENGRSLQSDVEKVLKDCLGNLAPMSPDKAQQMIDDNNLLSAALKKLM